LNPFYPKDPHASFGKHVLTPTLALTSFAATTPDHWSVRYWDENLLHGARQQGRDGRAARPFVPRGMRAARGRPGARRRRAALAPHPARRGGRAPPAALLRHVRERISRGPAAAAVAPSARQLSDDDQPDRDARLPQPLRVLLSRDRRP